MNKDNSGPAFPNKTEATGWDGLRTTHFEHKGGMTLRDYFAAKAMQAMISVHVPSGDTPRYAYEIADAMLEARK